MIIWFIFLIISSLISSRWCLIKNIRFKSLLKNVWEKGEIESHFFKYTYLRAQIEFLLSGSAQLVKLIPDFIILVKGTIFWPNRVWKVYLDFNAPDFPKSSSNYLFCTEVDIMHGFRCFTAMCSFWLHCFLRNYSELPNF